MTKVGRRVDSLTGKTVLVIDDDPYICELVELALANIPGFTATTPPSKGTPAIMHWPALVSSRHIQQVVHVKGETVTVDSVLNHPDIPAVNVPHIEMP